MLFSEQFLTLIRENNNNEAVKLILEDCHYNPTVIERKSTLLHHAAEHENVEIAKYLLGKCSNINAQDSDGNTPLIVAVGRIQTTIIPILLAAGADVDIRNDLGDDALSIGLKQDLIIPILEPIFQALKTKYSSQEITDRLLDYDCALDQAVCSRDEKIVEGMIECGVPVNLPETYPLHIAVLLSDVETVKVLLDYGADVNAPGPRGSSPIHFLYSWKAGDNRDKLEILKLLLSEGVSLTSVNNRGCFQAGTCLTRGTPEMIRAILESNPDFSARNGYTGGTILHMLMFNENPSIVDELKPYIHMFDINAQDKAGHGPLSWAASKGNKNMVKFLLDQGAKINTPALLCLYLAKYDRKLERSRDQCLELVLERCLDPQIIFTATNKENRNPIIDEMLKNQRFDRINLALAGLAMCEKQGVTIRQRACSKIDSHEPLKTYFENCRRLLQKTISGSVTVFKLLNADDKKMVKYLNNEKLVSKLMLLNRDRKLKSVYWYYYISLKKRVSRGFVNKTLRDKAAKVICNIFGELLNPRDLVTEAILDNLNDQDLRRLYDDFKTTL